MKAFNIAATPQLYFGIGKISVLPSVIKEFGTNILLVTGTNSFSSYGTKLLEQFQTHGISFHHYTITEEPSPESVDIAVQQFSNHTLNAVVAIGGGSVLDAGKAISAMLPLGESVKDYLEGVGTKPTHPGVKIPFVAVPTTSGTGSEATKNAVLSEVGIRGYKKSLRHNNFVPDVAIIDPALTVTCSPSTTAASGMDAFTQLLESYLSTTANPITDALAFEGLQRISKSLVTTYLDGSNLEARSDMALASYLSGITLANAGLGLVHGFASTLGGYFKIPHGVICSVLMSPANKLTVQKLSKEKSNKEALIKYSIIGKLFAGHETKSNEYYIDSLLSLIESLTKEMQIPGLAKGGVSLTDLEKITKGSDNKNNPINLNHDEMIEVLKMAM